MTRSEVQIKFKEIVFDMAIVAGMSGFDYGLWLAWRPLGFIVGGLSLAAFGMFMGYDRQALRRRS